MLNEIKAEIEGYRNLVEGWDGEGGRAPSDTAIAEALAFIDANPSLSEKLHPYVECDGAVGFFYMSREPASVAVYIDISFSGNGQVSWYARGGGMKGGAIEVCPPAPTSLLEMCSALFALDRPAI